MGRTIACPPRSGSSAKIATSGSGNLNQLVSSVTNGGRARKSHFLELLDGQRDRFDGHGLGEAIRRDGQKVVGTVVETIGLGLMLHGSGER